jgi:hypothetical protein
MTPRPCTIFMLTLALTSALSACGDSAVPDDYVKIAGGGLVFNYRYAQATMIVVAKQMSPLPEGGSVVVVFDIPGEPPQRIGRPVQAGKLTYKLESRYLYGLKKGVPLRATLLLFDASGKELDRDEMTRTPDVDQDSLPSEPADDPSHPGYVPREDG